MLVRSSRASLLDHCGLLFVMDSRCAEKPFYGRRFRPESLAKRVAIVSNENIAGSGIAAEVLSPVSAALPVASVLPKRSRQ